MKVLLVGPSPDLITGQSVAFNYLVGRGYPKVFNSGGSHFFEKLVFFLKYLISIPCKVIWYRPDTIYVTISRTTSGFLRDLFLFFIAKFFRIKVVVHLHGSDFALFVKSATFMKPLIERCYNNISGAIVLSEGMRSQFNHFPTVETFVVNNCFSASGFNFAPNVLSGSLKVLYLSNLMKSKGVIELIEAVKVVNANGGNIHLRLAGRFLSDGEFDGQALEEKVRSLLDSSIEYVGVLQAEEKDLSLNWCNCVALPSYYPTEAQPLALIEAMAAGRYILTSQAGYIPEFVHHGKNGYVLSEVSIRNIVDALTYIIDNDNDNDVVSASKFNAVEANKKFSKERYVKQIFNIVRTI